MTASARLNVRRAVLSAVCLVAVLSLCELFLRILKPEVVGTNHQPCIYVPNQVTGYSYIPGSSDEMQRNFEIDTRVFINSRGFHDIERAPEETLQARRIAVIGDSFTASLHVPVSNAWTQVLEKELSQGRKTDVYNLGLDGTGTDVQVAILKDQFDRGMTFDVVIVAFYRNDADDVAFGPVSRAVHGPYVITYQDESQEEKILQRIGKSPNRPVAWLYARSYLFRAAMNVISRNNLLANNFVGPKQVGLQVRRVYDARARLEKTFGELIALAQKQSFELLVVPIPDKDDPGASMGVLMDNLSPQLAGSLRILDVKPSFEGLATGSNLRYKDLFWKRDGHFNVDGNRILALALAGMLNNMVK